MIRGCRRRVASSMAWFVESGLGVVLMLRPCLGDKEDMEALLVELCLWVFYP